MLLQVNDESLVDFASRSAGSGADAYLALLAWVAEQHGAELGEFIRQESGNSPWLWLDRSEIAGQCRQNVSRQIGRTPYWAVLNLEPAIKRRFLFRLLEFVGYSGATIETVCTSLGLGREVRRRFRLLVA